MAGGVDGPAEINRRHRRDKEAYVPKSGKKPASWTTGMLWSEHYNK